MQEKNLEKNSAKHIFRISGAYYKEKCFPGLNELISKAERHPLEYGKMKKQYSYVAINSIRIGLKGWKAKGTVTPHYTFCEPIKGKKRDYDNISSAARKIINDALTMTHTIVDDNPSYLNFGTNTFIYGDKPYIEVRLEDDAEE